MFLYARNLGTCQHNFRGYIAKRAVRLSGPSQGFLLQHGLSQLFIPTHEERQHLPAVAISGLVTNLPSKAGINALTGRHSTAKAVAQTFMAGGAASLRNLRGSFSILVADPSDGSIHLLRDQLGGRSAFFHFRPPELIISSHAHLIGPFQESPFEENKAYLLERLLYAGFPRSGKTPFKDVDELLPGEHRRFNQCEMTVDRSSLTIPEKFNQRSAETSVTEFKPIFEQAVTSTIRAHHNIGIMLSGGLDSTPATAVAMEKRQPRQNLFAVSWTFQGREEADEGRWIEMLSRHLKLPLKLFDGWQHLPFSDLTEQAQNPGFLEYNPFRPLIDHAINLARGEGADAIMNFCSGDFLYPSADMMADYLIIGRHYRAIRKVLSREISNLLKSHGNFSRASHLRAWIALLLRHFRSNHPNPFRREFLNQELYRVLPSPPRSFLKEENTHPVKRYVEFMLEQGLSFHRKHESHFSERYGIHYLDPYQNEELAEFFLALPFHHSYMQGHTKWIMRQSCKNLLPGEIAEKSRTGNLLGVLGIGYKRARSKTREIIFTEHAAWADRLNTQKVDKLLNKPNPSEADLVLVAQLLGYCLWRRNIRCFQEKPHTLIPEK